MDSTNLCSLQLFVWIFLLNIMKRSEKRVNVAVFGKYYDVVRPSAALPAGVKR